MSQIIDETEEAVLRFQYQDVIEVLSSDIKECRIERENGVSP